MYGAWEDARQTLETLNERLRGAATAATKLAAIKAQSAVKRRIHDQDPRWEPLKAATIRRKGSSKILIDKADLVNSITYQITGPYSAFIGVLRSAIRRNSDRPLVNIARVHEYGFMGYVTNSRTGARYFLRIPARAFLGNTLAEIKDALFELWREEVARAVAKAA